MYEANNENAIEGTYKYLSAMKTCNGNKLEKGISVIKNQNTEKNNTAFLRFFIVKTIIEAKISKEIMAFKSNNDVAGGISWNNVKFTGTINR